MNANRSARNSAWANSWANAANVAANVNANTFADDFPYPLPFTAELPTCKDQPKGPDEAYLYFLNAQDILDAATSSLVNDSDQNSWKKLRREGIRCITRALSLDPSNRTYLLRRAEVNDDDPLLVIRDITKVIEMAPDDTGLYLLRAEAYVTASQLKPALADYNKAISLESKDADHYRKRSLFFALHMKDTENALADLNRVLEIDPNDAIALGRRADIYVGKKDYANALKDISTLIEQHPYAFYYVSRSEILEAAGQLDKALADANTAIKLSPNTYSPYEQRAKLYRKTGKIALAVRDESTAKRLKAKLQKELAGEK
jgi:tetratricopeptide (TPR) repeat protein